MNERALSAGGKLFLSGEYAVLWGGVARVACVSPRLSALVRPLDDRKVVIALSEGRLSGVSTPAGVRWANPVPEPFRVVARTIDLAYRALGREGAGLALAIEPSATHRGRKLGFGSSARAAVLAAEAARSALSLPVDALKLALVGHADAQGWAGSGADVAACFAGGVVRYRRYALDALKAASVGQGFQSGLLSAPAVDARRVAEPTLPMAYVFTGDSASTTAMIHQAERTWSPSERAAFVETSDALGDRLELSLARHDFDGLRQICSELQTRLFELIGHRHEALERLLALAASYGCTGKQSGAGGGDGVVLFAPDLARRTALLEGFSSRGFYGLPVECTPGVRGDAAASATLQGWLAD